LAAHAINEPIASLCADYPGALLFRMNGVLCPPMQVHSIDIVNGVATFSQSDYRLKRHAHFPIEVVFSLSGQLTIETDRTPYHNIQSALIDSHVPHTFSCLNGQCQLYFIDPTSAAGRHLRQHYLDEGKKQVLIDGLDAAHFPETHIHPFLTDRSGLTGMDSRIARCVEWINANYCGDRIHLAKLSEIVFLSESRLAHLFRQQVGISIRQYILWKKVELAVARALEGCSLTDCAYTAGFADSSHFIKTFQKMFGIYPSFALKK
jgi:AraC-like DNA-binding protein